jgi:hypothetical protein
MTPAFVDERRLALERTLTKYMQPIGTHRQDEVN